MGIIIKQSIKGSIWSYLGVGIGFVTTAYLYPNYLSTDVIGLFGLLVSWSVLLAQFSSLGINGVTERLFPYFRNRDNRHNGYLFIAFMVMAVGFGLFLVAYYIFSPWLIESNIDKSQLFSEYIWLLIPLTFFTLLYSILDTFNKLLYDAVFGIFLNEFLQRLIIILLIVIFIIGWIDLHHLIITYAAAVCLKGGIIFFFLLIKGEIDIGPRFIFIDKELRKKMIDVAIFGILASIGGNIVFNIDKIIINQMLGLSYTGVYTIAFFFGTLVVIPSRTLLRISGTLIADAWRANDKKQIFDLYRKSCINQFIIASFLFGGIWINIDNIIVILGPDYESAKWIIFLIGIGNLIDMATGVNGLIISYSKYYRKALWFLLILVILVLVFMYLLIPIWGIIGAALAISFSLFINNLLRFIFLYNKYKFQPFNNQFLVVIAVFFLAYFISNFIPQLSLFWDIIFRSTVFTAIYGSMVISLSVSVDINESVYRIWKYIIRLK